MWLLAGAAMVAALPAAAAAKKAAADDPRIGVLEQELRDVKSELAEIKHTQTDQAASQDNSAALIDLKRSTSAQYVDVNNRFDALTRADVANGRVTFVSPDSRFSFALRTLVQFDAAYFGQGRNPASVDLNSGTNFRRAQVGFTGTAWRDFSYNLTLDFAGNGVEKSGYIYTAFIEYDGFKPFGFRVGAFAPPAGLDDSTGSADLLFLERASGSDIARNIAGSPSREGASIFAQGDNYLVSVAYTTKKAGDAATFDEQSAVVGRAAWLAYSDSDLKWELDADFTHVFKLPDQVANGATSALNNLASFSNGPEIAVDSTKTVNTGNIDASTITEFGFETGLAWREFYGQGGYYHYRIERRASALPDPDFDGWYALLTWSITGESHAYDPVTASFRGLRPAHPLGDGGFGAFELKARYSNIDLNYLPFTATTAGGVPGGEQNVWTLGANWYPTQGIRFALDYDNVHVSHPNAVGNNISTDVIALRSQLSL